MHFHVSLKDLEDIEGRVLSGGSDDEIVQRLRHVYEFLSLETIISIADGIVSIDIPERVISNKLEAIRMQEKASQRAKSGDYAKAISIWERVLELDPTYVEARRNLGMALMEVNQPLRAKECLIEAATLDPKDSWSYVVLGNILARNENDIVGATRFYKKALEINPKDSWAINSMGGIALEQEKWDEAINWFDQSIAINPKFANPYYGKSHAYVGKLQPDKALASLNDFSATPDFRMHGHSQFSEPHATIIRTRNWLLPKFLSTVRMMHFLSTKSMLKIFPAFQCRKNGRSWMRFWPAKRRWPGRSNAITIW